MATIYNPSVVSSGLRLYLDAGNGKSYPGSGTSWFDLSGNETHFSVSASAFVAAAGSTPAYFNFEGSYGAATIASDVPNFSAATVMIFSTILNSTGNWRTLMRGASADHQVIIQEGSNLLGMYDNNGGNFLSSGFSVTSLPNPYTQFNCLTWRLAQTDPYYRFSYNGPVLAGSITDSRATFNNGFRSIGAYWGGPSQYWGKIGAFLYYNRSLSDEEISQNYNALRGRFGL